jgi:PBP1b-binding outer membrane lipoprotein LpoB
MLQKLVAVTVIAFGISGCANDHPAPAGFANVSVLSAPQARLAAQDEAPVMPPKKTMSDKVLAAIALERVTGMKPDPGRFSN